MKQNDHLRALDNLRSLMAMKTDMNLSSHNDAQKRFQEIAERLVRADEMEKKLEELGGQEDNIVPLNPDE